MAIDELTNERLLSQDKKFTLMFEQNNKDHSEIKEAMEKGFSELKEMIRDIAKSKANKWVEKFLVWAGSIIGLGFLTYLGSLIYKATVFFK